MVCRLTYFLLGFGQALPLVADTHTELRYRHMLEITTVGALLGEVDVSCAGPLDKAIILDEMAGLAGELCKITARLVGLLDLEWCVALDPISVCSFIGSSVLVGLVLESLVGIRQHMEMVHLHYRLDCIWGWLYLLFKRRESLDELNRSRKGLLMILVFRLGLWQLLLDSE